MWNHTASLAIPPPVGLVMIGAMKPRHKPRRSPHQWIWLIAGLMLLVAVQLLQRDGELTVPAPGNTTPAGTHTSSSDPALAFLPRVAHTTLALIDRGGPFPHRQDGSVFQNRERLLPQRARGHYREYTVATPGLNHRGARRIVTGGDPPREWYYTADHYRSFRAFQREHQP